MLESERTVSDEQPTRVSNDHGRPSGGADRRQPLGHRPAAGSRPRAGTGGGSTLGAPADEAGRAGSASGTHCALSRLTPLPDVHGSDLPAGGGRGGSLGQGE